MEKKRPSYEHGLKVGNYILTKMIFRASVAHFMLDQLETNNYMHKAVGIIN